MDVTFDTYIDHILAGTFVWTTADVRAAVFLKDTWVPNKSDAFLLDAQTAGAQELSDMGAGGYARALRTSATKALDAGGHRGLLRGAVIDFGVVATGYDFDTIILFVQVTDDTDSWMLSAYDVGAQTTDGTNLRFVSDSDGFYQVTAP